MPRDPIPTWFFALVVVRQGDRFLLVHEAKHGQDWYLPAGRVEPGESLTDAAWVCLRPAMPVVAGDRMGMDNGPIVTVISLVVFPTSPLPTLFTHR